MMALSRCAINDNYLAVFSYLYIWIIYHFYLSKPYSFLSAQMPSYPKFSKEDRHIRPYAIPSVFQHLNQSPQHILSALLNYKALRAGPYPIHSLIPLQQDLILCCTLANFYYCSHLLFKVHHQFTREQSCWIGFASSA